MNNATIWEASHLYGKNVILPGHNNPTLFSKWLERYQDLETQLLTDTNGEKIEGKNRYTDGSGQEWGPIRWPYDSNTNKPYFRDYPRSFLFDDHLKAIGSSGWDWKNKEVRYLGYDFDSIVGHAEGLGHDEASLERVAKNAPNFVDVIRSTRGQGKHLYVFFDEPFPKAETHDEHAAVARSILQIMSARTGFNFETNLDCCGRILWLWHRDATTENRGFTTLKEATTHLTAADVPPNWRDHIEVVGGRRGKVKVRGYTPDGSLTAGDDVDEDTEASPKVQLEECHTAFLEDLEGTGYSYYWVHDHHLAQTHTCAIQQVHEEWAAAGHPMKGEFETSAPGTDKTKPNCYMRPRLGGGWDVYRFGEGVPEHSLWDDFNGKTHITLNIEPSLRQGALAAGAIECADPKKGFKLPDVPALHSALEYLGSKFRLPNDRDYTGRTIHLKTRPSDDRIMLEIERKKDDSDWVGWEKKTASIWLKLLTERVNTRQDEDRTAAYWDNKVRLIKAVSMMETGSVAGEFATWVLKDNSGSWVRHPKDHITAIINKKAGPEALAVLATAIDSAWTKVNKPFEPEYPGGREWNYDAPQYEWKPRPLKEGESPRHPHWDMVFNHCGTGLDKYVQELDWCKEWGIKSGGDYLRTWVAAMLRYPYCRLPYLFMFSEANNTGKTTWHETVKLLLKGGRGYGPADKALTSSGDFNGELSNVLLGTIDETDIARAGKSVYNKVKDWTTAITFSIHGKYREVYVQPNILHLIQTSNSRHSCPVYGGDSRITVIEVPVIKEKIGKEDLTKGCKAEGPDFMATLMALPLPKHSDRMRVPVIETESKASAIADNRDELEAYLEEKCSYVPGSAVKMENFYTAFLASLEKFQRDDWPLARVRSSLPSHFPHGKYSNNARYIGNLMLGVDDEPTDIEAPKFVLVSGRLVKQ